MPKLKELQGVLAANVERLRKEFAPEDQRTMNRFAKWTGIGNSALQALKDATGDPKLSTILRVAQRFGMEPWQLFIPGASPAARPRIVTPEEIAWYLKLEKLREELAEPPGRDDPDPPALMPRPIPRRVAHRRRKTRT